MRLAVLLLLIVPATPAQNPGDLPRTEAPGEARDQRLPNGKSQRAEIAKADYKSNLEDAAKLVELTQDIESEFEQSDANIVQVKTLKKLEEVEKLARRIHGRLKRF